MYRNGGSSGTDGGDNEGESEEWYRGPPGFSSWTEITRGKTARSGPNLRVESARASQEGRLSGGRTLTTLHGKGPVDPAVMQPSGSGADNVRSTLRQSYSRRGIIAAGKDWVTLTGSLKMSVAHRGP